MQVEYRVAPISYGSDYKIKYHPYYLVSLKPKDYSFKSYPFLKIPFSIISVKNGHETPFTRPVMLTSSKSMSEIFIRYHESVY
jgi:sulfur transfer complex TusBCD TusB component (DsrH family)